MTRCLREKTLLLLSAGGGDSAQRLHLKTCEFCGERYRRMVQELELITSTLRQDPPVGGPQIGRPIPVLYRAAPIIAVVLFAVALIWGESRFLHSNLPESSEPLASSDWSQLLEQVSEALFPADALSQTEVTPAGSDWVSVQNALGESCSTECQEVFANLATEPRAMSERLNNQQKMERVIARQTQ
jgi:hypothetical protein